ncbi:nuclear transport factor 2-like isoform X2 [Zingiber officinale]|uniref:nuclear transport factor 2-like isoform X2 n=1 Tax=Zingiber officinale TaxID=94328 RepID=UPI001C4AA2D1|nr:nuclear transport factor 2-like isoform X2 [Zingiber officinale]
MAADRARLPAHVVGMAFANQYYQILTSSPQLLFRFYKEGSTLSRLDHRGEMISVTGMDAIKEKLLSVDYSEYRAEIKTVDGQKSMDGCVTVLVAGYLTGKDDAKKKFAQFFMLAPQDKGYYVLNDIFRLLAPEQAEQLEQQENEVPEEEKLDEAETIDPSAEIPCSVHQEVQTGKEIDGVSESLQAVTLNPSSSTTLEESPRRESYASIVNVMKEKPTPPVSPPVPSKAAVVKTGQPASPISIPALVTENGSVTPNAADSYRRPEPEAVGYSIHLKNLPLYVTPEQLQEEFKKFGPIKPGGIHIKCFRHSGICFGFVDFEVADAVARAIKASPVTIEGRPAFVEKQRSSNLRASNRGRYRNERTRGRRYPSAASGVYGKGEDSSRTDFGDGGGSWSW